MLAPLGYDRMPLAPAWLDWNAPIEIDRDLAAELGVVAWYPGWPWGGNTLLDLSGNGNNGTLVGTTWTYGQNHEPSLQFAGNSSSYAELPTLLPATNPFSFFGSFQRRTGASLGSVVTQYTSGSLGRFIFLQSNSNDLRLDVEGATAVTASGAVPANLAWASFCLTRSGSSYTLCTNGNTTTGTNSASVQQVALRLAGDASSTLPVACGISWFGVSHIAIPASTAAWLSLHPYALAWQPSRLSMFLGSDFVLDPDIAWDIEAGADDADYVVGSAGSEYDAGEVLNCGFAGIDYYAGLLRFDTTIPAGATITSAALRLTHGSSSTFDYTGDTITIDAFDTDDAAMPTFGDPFVPTTASVTDDFGNLTAGQRFSTADLASVIQEVVSRPGFGGSICLRIQSDSAGSSLAFPIAAVENTDGWSPASLVVTWTVPSGVSVTPAAAGTRSLAIAPTAQLGSLSLTPAQAEASALALAPTVQLGSLSLTPTQAEFAAVALAPTVQLGAISVTPAVAASSALALAPTVALGSMSITPAHAESSLLAIAPTIVLGALSLTPAHAEASTIALAPSVQLGSVSATPAHAESSALAIAPTVDAGGNVQVSPDAAIAAALALAPSVLLGSVSVTPAAAVFSVVAVAPTVEVGDASVIILGPYYVAASQSYVAGSKRSQSYLPGSLVSQHFVAGSVKGQTR